MPENGHVGASWRVLDTRLIYSAKPWVELSVQQVQLPNGKVISNYHKIRLPEFCVIFTETCAGDVVVLRQYRHGIGRSTLSLPAGLLDDGEDPLECAKRELFEETGYAASEWRSLGSYVPNSNYGCGKAHLFYATGAVQEANPDSGDLEDSELLLMSPPELLSAVAAGEVSSLSMVAAISMATHPMFRNGAEKANRR